MISFYLVTAIFAALYGMCALYVLVVYMRARRKHHILLIALFLATSGLILNVFMLVTYFFNFPQTLRVLSYKLALDSMPIIIFSGALLWFKMRSDHKKYERKE